MLELGISTLCDKQRLHRESWIIRGEDRYSVKKGIECWMRDVEEGLQQLKVKTKTVFQIFKLAVLLLLLLLTALYIQQQHS